MRWKDLWSLIIDNRGRTIAIGAGLISFVTAVLKGKEIYGFTREWVSAHVVVAAGKATPDTALVLLVGASVLLVAVLGIACIVLLMDDLRQRKGSPGTVSLRKALQAVIENARRIVNQTYPATTTPPWLFERMEIEISIASNGDTVVKRVEHLRAEAHPLRYWGQTIVGEDDSKPIDFVEQLNYTISDVTSPASNLSVAYLVLRNEPRMKEIGVFHLPEIEPNEAAARIVKTEFAWPGLSTKLRKTGTETWAWTVKSRKDVPLFQIAVYYDRALGPISCDVLSAKTAGSKLEALEEATRRGWKFTVPNSPANSFTHELKFTRVS